jgi:small subunit ribosomal protein S17e
MGKVRIEMVKRLSTELIKKYPYSFTTLYDENKEFLKKIELDVSKKLRNKIAGYITTLILQEIVYEEVIEEVEI